MGVIGCIVGKVLWKAKGLTLKMLKDLQCGDKMIVDGNYLAYKLAAGKTINEVIHIMATYLKEVAFSGGFKITVVVDGDARPDCKRASLERRKNIQLDQINAGYSRFKALELRAGGRAQEDEIRKEIDDFSKEAKRLEKKIIANNIISSRFS